MNLSVEARVKARISTPYIDADGRGVRGLDGAPVDDKPLCMLSPAEFHHRMLAQQQAAQRDAAAIHAAGSASSSLHADAADPTLTELKRLETRESTLLRELAEKKANFEKALGSDFTVDVARAQSGLLDLYTRRRQARASARHERQVALDAAYNRRLESDAAMERFNMLSRDTRTLDVLAKEDALMDRFAALRNRRDEALSGVREATEKQEGRSLAETRAVQAVHEARRAQQEAAAAERSKQEFARELSTIAENRRRQRELDAKRREVQLEEDASRAVWRAKTQQLTEAERSVAKFASMKEQALHSLVAAHAEARASATYEQLRALQREFEAHSAEIQAMLDRQTKGRGAHLEALFVAARDTANKKRVIFHGLEMLCVATTKRSALTPEFPPSMDAAVNRAKHVGLQFPEAAPPPRAGAGPR